MNLIERRKINTLTLKKIFEKNKLSETTKVPLLTIDVEGLDYAIFKQAMQVKNRFDLIIVEDKMVNLSTSYPHSNICSVARNNNYILIAKTPLNSIYIDKLSPNFNWLPERMKREII